LYGGLAQDTELPIYTGDLWNSLLPDIKDVKSLTTFKREEMVQADLGNVL